jgi:hypothetical protein
MHRAPQVCQFGHILSRSTCTFMTRMFSSLMSLWMMSCL